MEGELRLSRERVRALDAWAIRELGLPGAVLMENAGRGAAEILLAALRVESLAGRRGAPPWRIGILCGRGNNGGDGYVVARHVWNAGQSVECFSTCDASELSGDAATNRRAAEQLGISVQRIVEADELGRERARWSACDALVDGLLGTGATGAPRGPVAAAIEALAAVRGPFKLALDLPSGLDADTGEAPGACAAADVTVTFVAPKLGFANEAAKHLLGHVLVAGIGVAPRAFPAVADA